MRSRGRLRRSAWRRVQPEAEPSARLVVDLGALQATGEIDVDRLPFGVRVECDVARLAMPVARLLPAPERKMDLRARGPGVDVDDAGLEVAHRPECGVDVAREDARREAVARLIEREHRRAVVVDRDDRQDRAEDLLLADPVHRSHSGEDRRLEEMAVRQSVAGRAIATENEIALAPPDVDVRRHLVGGTSVDERADVDGRIRPGAEAQTTSARLEAFEERL